MRRQEVEKLVAELDAIYQPGGTNDPEEAHGAADDVLLRAVPAEVAEAYRRLVERCEWWAYA
jgi:hypothetical protein